MDYNDLTLEERIDLLEKKIQSMEADLYRLFSKLAQIKDSPFPVAGMPVHIVPQTIERKIPKVPPRALEIYCNHQIPELETK